VAPERVVVEPELAERLPDVVVVLPLVRMPSQASGVGTVIRLSLFSHA